MKRFHLLLPLMIGLTLGCFAQTNDVKTLQESARTYVRNSDFSNAIVVLNQALQLAPDDIETLKQLAFCYYLQKNYSKSMEIAKPFPDRKDADEECFQILGLVYKAIDETKDCEKMYQKGIKRFPNSGVLYSEYGEVLWSKQDYDAIKQWEKGIEVDPNYSGNYYNAAKYYYFTVDKVWGLIYGEIFINLESYSSRTPEVKSMLVDGYKKLFSDYKTIKAPNSKNPFFNAFLTIMGTESAAIAQGINAESLSILRSRFLLEWFDKYSAKFPFRLFEYQHQLMKDGIFDAYNEWIFGAAQNLPAFQAWTNSHTDDYNRFINFQKGRIFKMPAGQYYHSLQIK